MSILSDINGSSSSGARHSSSYGKSNNRIVYLQDIPSLKIKRSHKLIQNHLLKTVSNRSQPRTEWIMYKELHSNRIPATGNNSVSRSDLEEEDCGIGVYLDVPFWKKKKEANAAILKQRQGLPIFARKKELMKKIKQHQTVIVVGETGSGKTTQIPQYLVAAGYAEKGKIVCTQPRRLAAMSIANRVADEYGCRLGDKVGYKIRFEECASPKTNILYMTDGMLLRERGRSLQFDEYSVIMLDEAHERTINTDVLFALIKEKLQHRKDLKLIVSSATLEAEKFSRYFNNAPIFRIKGRTYPVKKIYDVSAKEKLVDGSLEPVLSMHETEQKICDVSAEDGIVDRSLAAVMSMHETKPKICDVSAHSGRLVCRSLDAVLSILKTGPHGDILVFLPGKKQIEDACYELMELEDPSLIILPLYAGLPPKEHTQVFIPTPKNYRKVVFATNIAETSITVDGIYFVVDPGYFKQKVCDQENGMDELKVMSISKAQADQRAGRAGRTGPGVCYRLYTQEFYQETMLPTNLPEIQRVSLAGVALSLAAMGIKDLHAVDWMDPPSKEAIDNAYQNLRDLGALDLDGELTDLGRKMNCFPLEPALSKILLTSVDLKCSFECLTIVSMINGDILFYRPKGDEQLADAKKAKFHHPKGDHLTLLTVYQAWTQNKFSDEWCYEHFLNSSFLRTAFSTRKQLMDIMIRLKLEICKCRQPLVIQKAIFSGYKKNLARWDPLELAYIRQVDKRPLQLHEFSSVYGRNNEWIVYHTVLVTNKPYMRTVTVVEKDWIDQESRSVRK